MAAPLYPHEVWRGNSPKSSQLYRCVVIEYQKFEFEMFAGKDAMDGDIWQKLDKDEDGCGWWTIANAMAMTLWSMPKAQIK